MLRSSEKKVADGEQLRRRTIAEKDALSSRVAELEEEGSLALKEKESIQSDMEQLELETKRLQGKIEEGEERLRKVAAERDTMVAENEDLRARSAEAITTSVAMEQEEEVHEKKLKQQQEQEEEEEEEQVQQEELEEEQNQEQQEEVISEERMAIMKELRRGYAEMKARQDVRQRSMSTALAADRKGLLTEIVSSPRRSLSSIPRHLSQNDFAQEMSKLKAAQQQKGGESISGRGSECSCGEADRSRCGQLLQQPHGLGERI